MRPDYWGQSLSQELFNSSQKATLTLSIRFPPALRQNIRDSFTAFRHVNYRIWSVGAFITAIGGWMQSTAQGYLIYDLTQSTTFLGLISFTWGVPIWIFTLLGGVAADRVSRRTMLMLTNTVFMSLSLILSALIFTGLVQPWHILVTAFFSGTANAFDGPSRNGFVNDLVGRADISNAVALNATIFHLATMIGPAVGGLAYALLGPGWCFAVNASAYVVMLVVLARMKVERQARRTNNTSPFEELVEGIRYSFKSLPIRALLFNLAVYAAFGFSMMTLIPAWAVDVLKGDVRLNGLLLSARGVGSLVGALMIAFLGRRHIRGWLLTAAMFVLPTSTLVFSQLRVIPSSLALVGVMGWGMLVWGNTSNAILQTEVSDDLRGRVMGLFVLILFGFQPLGSLLVGSLAGQVGTPQVVLGCGIILLITAGLTYWRIPLIRRLG